MDDEPEDTGLHVYVYGPDGVIELGVTIALAPEHIPTVGGNVIVGVGLTTIFNVLIATQPLAVTVTPTTPAELTLVVCVVAPFVQL